MLRGEAGIGKTVLLTIFNSGGYRVWSPGAWWVMPEA